MGNYNLLNEVELQRKQGNKETKQINSRKNKVVAIVFYVNFVYLFLCVCLFERISTFDCRSQEAKRESQHRRNHFTQSSSIGVSREYHMYHISSV